MTSFLDRYGSLCTFSRVKNIDYLLVLIIQGASYKCLYNVDIKLNNNKWDYILTDFFQLSGCPSILFGFLTISELKKNLFDKAETLQIN